MRPLFVGVCPVVCLVGCGRSCLLRSSEALRCTSSRHRVAVVSKSLLVLRENCVRHGIASAVGDDAEVCFEWLIDHHLLTGACAHSVDVSRGCRTLYEDLACTEVGFKTESPGALGDRALCAAVPSNVSWVGLWRLAKKRVEMCEFVPP
ncbi:hypothetical protein L210DRAFT_3086025 [Boletus edulis BED1]|uniref:Uncharacterized protein n=1 Tax=Boletus edulis BED1 TaxID=1328754 RepID=A0AAD4BGB5_BOLED|nr:hypothetical protein L210DRAFT_3086025 [Boletus edulis BED1]